MAELIPLFDTHAHLDMHQFADDRDATVARAWEAGLVGLVTLGVDLETSAAAIGLSERHPAIFAAAGFHPHEASRYGARAEARLRELHLHPRVVAVGEIGLDYFRNHSEPQTQRRAFARQLALAAELAKPVAVHDREAHDDVLAALREWSAGLPAEAPRGVLHCFSGDRALAWACVELGFFISLAGPVTYPKNEELRAVARELPLDRLVAETDSPYLAPQSRRGQRNEPAQVRAVVETIAAERGLPVEQVAEATTANARRLFRLDQLARPAGAQPAGQQERSWSKR